MIEYVIQVVIFAMPVHDSFREVTEKSLKLQNSLQVYFCVFLLQCRDTFPESTYSGMVYISLIA